MFSKNRLWPAILVALLAGCASTAPPLPPDTTSVNRTHGLTLDDFTPAARAMTCDQIVAERATIATDMQKDNNKIASDRTRNEAALGVTSLTGVFGLPALLLVKRDLKEKDQITALYHRQDTLIKLAELKHCASSP